MSRLLICALICLATAAPAQSIQFGDNSSLWANDNECDDRRFFGQGMAPNLDDDDILHDANDCQTAYDRGLIKLVDPEAGKAATICSQIDFGDNSGEWARDGECDDYRFAGKGMNSIISIDDIRKDASDCRRLCEAGKIYLRLY